MGKTMLCDKCFKGMCKHESFQSEEEIGTYIDDYGDEQVLYKRICWECYKKEFNARANHGDHLE